MSPLIPSQGNNRDDHVVEEICGYVTSAQPCSFFLFAGAGSGKTRTLVEVLRRITGVIAHEVGGRYARQLRSRGQSVRVITYTKNATDVVTGRLGDNYLTAVSTIHSFCWDLIQGFNEDICEALIALKQAELDDERRKAEQKAKGVNENDRQKFATLEAEKSALGEIKEFRYHPDRNTYGQGALQHAEVLDVAAWLIKHRPTLQRILEDRHPLIFIDESQDTMKCVLDALIELSEKKQGRIALGLIGDHRQRIYPHGHRDLPSQIPPTWAKPALQMNHRSQRRIVDLINHIWEADVEGRTQPKTGVAQHPRTEKSGGTVRIFVGNTKVAVDEKLRAEAICAEKMAQATGLAEWTAVTRSYKLLALEHKLAARRGGFYDTYVAMELLDKNAAGPQGNGENSGPAVVRVLLGPMLELTAAVAADGTLNEFVATNVLRRHGALSNLSNESSERQARLDAIHRAVTDFATACASQQATVRDVLVPVISGKLFEAGDRLTQAFGDNSAPPAAPQVKTTESKEDRLKRGWHALFNARWKEIPLYRAYLAGEADFATHQVVKGSEFSHVMVVMDDEEAGGFLFSYDKVFGGAPLSKRDTKNADDNNETTIDRTLRLLYVTCSRAEESLALMLWADNPKTALERIRDCGWFAQEEIVGIDELAE